MSKLDELIKQYCPEGVNYKALWEVTAWDKRFNEVDNYKQKKVISYPYVLANKFKEIESEEGNVRLLSTGNYIGFTTEELADENLCEGEIIAIPWGGKLNIKYFNGKFVTADNRIATSLDRKVLSNKFLYYCMLIQSNKIQSFYRGSGIQHPSMKQVLELKIPVPPIQVQEEIVRILDKFTELTAELEEELEEELENRKKQYEYYRNKLLELGDEVEYKEINEVCETTSNINWNKNKVEQFMYIDLSSVDRETHNIFETKLINYENAPSRAQKIIKFRDVIFATTRPTLKRFCIINKEYDNQICSTGFCVLRANIREVLPEWIYYQISLQRFNRYVEDNQQGASYPAISDSTVKKYKIPIPSLAEQERIVVILDKFEKLVNDMTNIGLPAEIEKRKQQYEYYRNKLLTFDEVTKNV